MKGSIKKAAIALVFTAALAAAGNLDAQGTQFKIANPEKGYPTKRLGRDVSVDGDTLIAGAPYTDMNEIESSGTALVFRRDETQGWTLEAELVPDLADPFEFFGCSVSISGDTAIVGAFSRDSQTGASYVFTRTGGVWTQQSKLTASDAAVGDHFGWSVSISGDTAVTGAYLDDHVVENAGSAYIFTRSGEAWTQQAKLTASDPGVDDRFAYSVSISGDTAIVGAFEDDDNGSNSGSAYIFSRSGTVWTQQSKLTPDDGREFDIFGYSVAVSGDTVLVGSPESDQGASNTGAAYVFTCSSSVWTQQAMLLPGDAAENDGFGFSVAVTGDTAVVGSISDDEREIDSGSSYVFTRSAETWNEQDKLVAEDGKSHDQFGKSVSVSGDTALVGAWYNDHDGADSGSVYVFTRSGGLWTHEAKLGSESAEGDEFGYAVEISGETALIGAPFDDCEDNVTGSVYVFSQSDGIWTRQAKLTPPKTDDCHFFGSSICFSNDTALIGSILKYSFEYNSGPVYIYTRSDGLWEQQQKLTSPDADPYNSFGVSLSISGDTAVVGSCCDQEGGARTGAVYVFTRSDGTWTETAKLTASDAADNDFFGYSVSISGDTIIIGAYGKDGTESGEGAVYVFIQSGGTWSQQAKLTSGNPKEGDQFGYSVSLSGDIAVIGMPGNIQRGAYIFKRTGDNWIQHSQLSSDDLDFYSFGCSVDISGDAIMVGDRSQHNPVSWAGAAYLFLQCGSEWIQEAKLTASDSAEHDHFGFCVSHDSKTALIGAPYKDDPEDSSGAVYAFDLLSYRSSARVWNLYE